MKIRIGALEIIDPSPEELDMLISKYGGAIQQGGDAPPGNGGELHGPRRFMQVPKTGSCWIGLWRPEAWA